MAAQGLRVMPRGIASRALITGRAGSSLAMAAGAMVLLGWAMDLGLLKSLVPGAVHMKPNTALGLLCAGAALALCLTRPAPWRVALVRFLAAGLLLLGAATLAQYALGMNFGIDEVLFKDTARAFNAAPGRMSPFTAFAFMLLGTALLLLGRQAWRGAITLACCAGVLMVGMVALLGYLWNAAELVTDSWAPPVALHTALALLGLGAGLLATHLHATRMLPQDPFSAIDRKLALAFWGMVLVLGVTTSFSYRSNIQFANAARLVAHTQQVRIELATLDGCMDHAESNQYHYLLAGDQASKRRFVAAAEGCRAAVQNLLGLVRDNEVQLVRAATLGPLVAQRLAALETVASLFESNGVDAARQALAFETGQQAMQQVERVIQELDSEERSLLQFRERTQSADRSTMLVALLFTLLVAVGIVSALVRSMRREVRSSAILRERAEEATQTKSAFLASMSHEIRTPMTGVLGMVDLLAREPLTPVQQSYVGAMRSSGRHLLNVINDILDFSRTETGTLELEEIDFSMPEILEQLRSLVHPLAVERGLDLDFSLTPHSPAVVRGDPTRLRQVLLNLVNNAIKFTERGTVTVTVAQTAATQSGPRYRFEVRDTGEGISEATLSQLFSPFVQADSSTARRHGGSGLGLAISKRLVEAMGGTIGAVSAPGLGSLFYFELPLVLGDPLQLVKVGTAMAPAAQPKRILVAEDVAINRQILRVALGQQGHTVVFAEDGAQALEMVQQEVFDLVLMDVQMPVMDGVEATRRIRGLEGRFRNLPILALTANVMVRERERYLEAGMNDCLMKPIEWDQLNAAVSRCPSATQVTPLLVDTEVHEALQTVIGATELDALMGEAMAAYKGYLADMLEAGSSEAQIGEAAHKLKGSSGTLGLCGIRHAATQVESAVEQCQPTRALVLALQAVVAATQTQLSEG